MSIERKTFYASDILPKKTEQKKISLTEATKGTMFGAGCGLVGGLLYAKFHNGNYGKSAFIGLIIGGVISKIFI